MSAGEWYALGRHSAPLTQCLHLAPQARSSLSLSLTQQADVVLPFWSRPALAVLFAFDNVYASLRDAAGYEKLYHTCQPLECEEYMKKAEHIFCSHINM